MKLWAYLSISPTNSDGGVGDEQSRDTLTRDYLSTVRLYALPASEINCSLSGTLCCVQKASALTDQRYHSPRIIYGNLSRIKKTGKSAAIFHVASVCWLRSWSMFRYIHSRRLKWLRYVIGREFARFPSPRESENKIWGVVESETALLTRCRDDWAPVVVEQQNVAVSVLISEISFGR